jgi:hypothetical protein
VFRLRRVLNFTATSSGGIVAGAPWIIEAVEDQR